MATQQKRTREDSKVFPVISSAHNLKNEGQRSGGQGQFWKTRKTIRDNKLLVEDLQEDLAVSGDVLQELHLHRFDLHRRVISGVVAANGNVVHCQRLLT